MVATTVANTLGALQISLTLSLALLGAVSLQCHYYFEHYGNDRKPLKALVLMLWAMEVFHAAILFHAVYVINVNGFGSTSYITDVPWSVKTLVPASAILDITVETCFAYRVKLLSRRWLVPTICWVLIAIRAGAVMASTDITFTLGIHTSVTKYKFVLGIALAPIVVIDFLIATSLLYWLSRIRSGFPSSDQVVNRLIVFAFECGVVSLCLGLLILITAMTMSTNYIWLSILCVHSKVYSNALILSLNRRHSMSQVYTHAQAYTHADPTTSDFDRVSKLLRFVPPKSATSKQTPTVAEHPVIGIFSRKGKDMDLEMATNTSQHADNMSMHS